MSRAAGNPVRSWLAGRPRIGPAFAAAIWVALIVACWGWGTYLKSSGHDILLGAPPLIGNWNFDLGDGMLVAVLAFAALAIATGPTLAERVRWPTLLIGSMLAMMAWAALVALVRDPHGISHPVRLGGEYLGTVPLVGSPGSFLTHFLDRIDTYVTHVRSHPPGMVLVLWVLDRVGLAGAGWAAGVTVTVGASTAPAALIALRSVADEARARAAAPYLVLLPAVIWIATSADAFYAGVIAWALALLVLAINAEGQRSDLLALAGGLLFGASAFLSYGIVLLATVPLAVAIAARRVRPLVIAAIGVAVVVVAFLAAGFWWVDGYLETRRQYLASSAQNRPFYFFVFNNLAAFALATGSAVAVALAYLRDRRVWLLVGGGLAAMILADLSGMSKAEVERIWLPFVPWVALATTALPVSRMRWFLAAQVALTIAIEVGVSTPW